MSIYSQGFDFRIYSKNPDNASVDPSAQVSKEYKPNLRSEAKDNANK